MIVLDTLLNNFNLSTILEGWQLKVSWCLTSVIFFIGYVRMKFKYRKLVKSIK